MPRTISFGVAAPLLACASAFAQTTPQPSPVRALVTTYCTTCHSQKLKTGGLALEGLDFDHPASAAETWEKVIVKLRSRAMPPPNSRRPDNAAYDSAATWLESELDRASAARLNPGRTASLHRLNRAEYSNSVRDLIGVEVDAQALLPPDEQAFGFENNGEALSIQPALLDRYIAAASSIAREAIGDPSLPAGFVRYGAIKNNANDLTYLRQTERLGEDFPLGSKGGVAARHFFPVDGEYILKLRLQRAWDSIIRGLNVPTQFEIRVDGKLAGQLKIAGGTAPTKTYQYDADDHLEIRVPITAGLHEVVATMHKTDDVEPEGVGADRLPLFSRQSDTATAPIAIAALLIGGPYNAKASVDSPSRNLIYVCHPSSPSDETACATKILTNLAKRAYRRAPSQDDIKTLVAFYNRARATKTAGGGFDDGIRAALERVLVSPDFLFRIESDPGNAMPGSVYRVSDVELASRLSYFLWSSTPDDTLLDLAIANKLHEPAVLKAQAARMFADPRARTSLVSNFFEDWLETRNVWLLNPDNTKFPFFDDNLRTAFVTETDLFLDDQLKQNHSLVDLLTSNETFLNEQLARHYGIPGVYGTHFRRVTLTDPNRFGLLGKASVLAVTSYTTRTAPTIRGKWLLENVLAAPPPAPPPNVPALDTSDKDGKPLTVREMLEKHRASPACASCHARMDPLGLSLENFDAIGRWRVNDAGQPINASGVLLDGTPVDGPQALRNALVAQKAQFAKAVTEKLLTYALGRGLEYYDAPAVRSIDRAAASDGYRWSSLITAIVNSAPFQMRSTR